MAQGGGGAATRPTRTYTLIGTRAPDGHLVLLASSRPAGTVITWQEVASDRRQRFELTDAALSDGTFAAEPLDWYCWVVWDQLSTSGSSWRTSCGAGDDSDDDGPVHGGSARTVSSAPHALVETEVALGVGLGGEVEDEELSGSAREKGFEIAHGRQEACGKGWNIARDHVNLHIR